MPDKIKGVDLYPLVHHIVMRALKGNKPQRGCEGHYQWAIRIPPPGAVPMDVAEALCTSVSHSSSIGLECFFQEPVYHREIRQVIRRGKVWSIRNKVWFMSEADKGPDGMMDLSMRLGWFVRHLFDGPLVMGESERRLLENL